MHEVRAVQRRPKTERWSFAALEAVTATPWSQIAPDGAEAEVVEPSAAVPEPPPPEARRHPNR
eukprot:9093047-Lingulodinium_polyedra.AAC.1